MITGSARAQQRVATFAIDAEIRFAGPAERAAFADDLTAAVTELVGRHHSEKGRKHRLVVAVHPALDSAAPPPRTEPAAERDGGGV
ncbi:hypothetical protein M1L60_03710 [Actinoplanes sp. TRM 88003]|uniref:Uncharacterized protein n=1 Tax=Paractinoplanes aksuensis TaxID=2939490 RepID=A0ABT1DHZ6_9ACTN|nr:hypothetical protein [Actinoplanes aksuensis]MCO8269695.1 hypothetical protein [Actinoplanes aksuensis]